MRVRIRTDMFVYSRHCPRSRSQASLAGLRRTAERTQPKPEQTSKQTSARTSKQTSKQTSKRPNKQTSKQTSKLGQRRSADAVASTRLVTRATLQHNASFRAPQGELIPAQARAPCARDVCRCARLTDGATQRALAHATSDVRRARTCGTRPGPAPGRVAGTRHHVVRLRSGDGRAVSADTFATFMDTVDERLRVVIGLIKRRRTVPAPQARRGPVISPLVASVTTCCGYIISPLFIVARPDRPASERRCCACLRRARGAGAVALRTGTAVGCPPRCDRRRMPMPARLGGAPTIALV